MHNKKQPAGYVIYKYIYIIYNLSFPESLEEGGQRSSKNGFPFLGKVTNSI